MKEKTYQTENGTIHYFTNTLEPRRITLVFLPGLTADHRLFDRQIEYFKDRVNVFVWDAPGHALSRPFKPDFELPDKARWLKEILELEEIRFPVLIGQSMGAYVGQTFEQYYPGVFRGFVSIDSAPLQRSYMTRIELWLLRRMEPIYRMYSWKTLLKAGPNGVAVTEYGRQQMREMMMDYEPAEYARLVGHGYRMIANAVSANLPYKIQCPALLICGEEDRAGAAKAYNKKWHARTGIPIEWIANAGHNSNSDQPEKENQLIEDFIRRIQP